MHEGRKGSEIRTVPCCISSVLCFIGVATDVFHWRCSILIIVPKQEYYLYYFLSLYGGPTLVFVNSINTVKRLTAVLTELKIPVRMRFICFVVCLFVCISMRFSLCVFVFVRACP